LVREIVIEILTPAQRDFKVSLKSCKKDIEEVNSVAGTLKEKVSLI
jgi:hypothetical protein